MASAVKWATISSASTVLSTELNSLGNGSRSNAGTEYDNATNKNQWGWVQLDATFGSNPTDRKTIDIYMVKALDGTNYEDGSSSVRPAGATWVASVDTIASTSAQKRTSNRFEIPPTKVKFIAENNCGVAFPASGSTVKLFTSNDEIQ